CSAARAPLLPSTTLFRSGRRSESSLYDFNLATYDEGDTFDQSHARGFIELFGLTSKLAAARDEKFGGESEQFDEAPCERQVEREIGRAHVWNSSHVSSSY